MATFFQAGYRLYPGTRPPTGIAPPSSLSELLHHPATPQFDPLQGSMHMR